MQWNIHIDRPLDNVTKLAFHLVHPKLSTWCQETGLTIHVHSLLATVVEKITDSRIFSDFLDNVLSTKQKCWQLRRQLQSSSTIPKFLSNFLSRHFHGTKFLRRSHTRTQTSTIHFHFFFQLSKELKTFSKSSRKSKWYRPSLLNRWFDILSLCIRSELIFLPEWYAPHSSVLIITENFSYFSELIFESFVLFHCREIILAMVPCSFSSDKIDVSKNIFKLYAVFLSLRNIDVVVSTTIILRVFSRSKHRHLWTVYLYIIYRCIIYMHMYVTRISLSR